MSRDKFQDLEKAGLGVKVNEIYFAHQGEGPRLGIPSIFLRLHGCPVKCIWCDTPFTWDGSEDGQGEDVDALAVRIIDLASRDCAEQVVVTGGEPLIAKALPRLLNLLLRAGLAVEVETSACLPPSPGIQLLAGRSGLYFNLSPKMPSAKPKLLPQAEILAKWLRPGLSTVFKVVVADEEDWQAMETLLGEINVPGPAIHLMPCAVTQEGLSKAQAWLLTRAKGSSYRVTTRMHVAAYGEERGR